MRRASSEFRPRHALLADRRARHGTPRLLGSFDHGPVRLTDTVLIDLLCDNARSAADRTEPAGARTAQRSRWGPSQPWVARRYRRFSTQTHSRTRGHILWVGGPAPSNDPAPRRPSSPSPATGRPARRPHGRAVARPDVWPGPWTRRSLLISGHGTVLPIPPPRSTSMGAAGLSPGIGFGKLRDLLVPAGPR